MANIKLHQALAILKDAKNKSNEMTKVYQKFQKNDLLDGLSRTYQPVNDGDHVYPSESKIVQVRVSDCIADARRALVDLFDVTATQEWGNTTAKADIVLDGKTLLSDVPVTYLLFLEKRLVDLHTFVKSLPTLAADVEWSLDEKTGLYRSAAMQTTKTKKISKVVTLAPATEQHPAQAQLAHEDVPEGTWTTVRLSGALPLSETRKLVDRVETLQVAVKMAREKANSVEVSEQKTADVIFNYIFGK